MHTSLLHKASIFSGCAAWYQGYMHTYMYIEGVAQAKVILLRFGGERERGGLPYNYKQWI